MSSLNDLKTLRLEIDKIDKRLFDLLLERSIASEKVGHLKKHLQLEIIDRQRESDILNKLQTYCEGKNVDFEYIKNIWTIILNKSHDIQIDGR